MFLEVVMVNPLEVMALRASKSDNQVISAINNSQISFITVDLEYELVRERTDWLVHLDMKKTILENYLPLARMYSLQESKELKQKKY